MTTWFITGIAGLELCLAAPNFMMPGSLSQISGWAHVKGWGLNGGGEELS